LQVLGQRKRLLNYMKKSQPAKYEEMVKALNIRVRDNVTY